MKHGLNLASFADANDDNNATLAEGHFIQAVLAKLGFAGALTCEHLVNGVQQFTPEFSDYELAARTMADAGTQKGEQQRSAAEGAGLDPTAPSLANLGIALDMALFLYVDLKRNPEDTANRHLVAPLIRGYREQAAVGKAIQALTDLATGPVADVQAKYAGLTAAAVVANFVEALPGVAQIVAANLPPLPA